MLHFSNIFEWYNDNKHAEKIYCLIQKTIYNTIKTKKIINNNKYSYYCYYLGRNDVFKHTLMAHGFHFIIKNNLRFFLQFFHL